MTGLDYLASIYRDYPPTIGGSPTFARFNPFAGGNNSEGVFEILPDNESRIKRIYRYNGTDSQVLSFSPNINPFKLDKGTEGIQFSSVDGVEKIRDFATDKFLNTKDTLKKQVGEK